ncbi:class I SAM-dependent methyltransferase [uncultured Paludibaculum sp.]|uniref:class I SAM-dependent methyltransferase n=1 Tax=uncultured Paludibaculum sp. TaxID=1765020 RepID=UPI002AABCE40|nr:class I SAM-dependent methyltransferase [uncultured Paludibaculum sp.]
METGLQAGLRLHKFKQNTELPRVRTALGILRSLQPENLLDIGSGRGTFLWPLLADFPSLPVTSAEIGDRRSSDLAAVRKGGVRRLTVVRADVHRLPFAPRSFDVVTMLEVLEHLADPQLALREGLRSARRSVVVSVPSTPDENPEHLHLFSMGQLTEMAMASGATRTAFEHVANHRVMLAQI